jgi:GNAT superfamily N-acetyltransferase
LRCHWDGDSADLRPIGKPEVNMNADAQWIVHPVTPERWGDLAALFEPDPVCRSCWCMWWRETRSEFFRLGSAYHREAMCAIVSHGEVPGLLGYLDGVPVGWVSVAPRECFPSILRSPRLRRVDDVRVWSIVCFAIAAGRRGLGLSATLLGAAVEYARAQGARAVEGYPVREVRGAADGQAFTGALTTFLRAGFEIVADRGGRRVVVRKSLEDDAGAVTGA